MAINLFKISKAWFDMSFEDHRITPTHTTLIFYMIDLNNRLSWVESFGLPALETGQALNISYNTFRKVLKELIEFGHVKLIKKSTNQHTANVISLNPLYQNLLKQKKSKHKATLKQGQKQSDIIKPIKLTNYKTILLSELKNSDFDNPEYFEITMAFYELFKKNLTEAGASIIKLEKAKGVWIDSIRLLIESDKQSKDSVRTVFTYLQKDEFWKKNILSTSKLREKFDKLLMNANANEKIKRNNQQPATSDEELKAVLRKHFG